MSYRSSEFDLRLPPARPAAGCRPPACRPPGCRLQPARLPPAQASATKNSRRAGGNPFYFDPHPNKEREKTNFMSSALKFDPCFVTTQKVVLSTHESLFCQPIRTCFVTASGGVLSGHENAKNPLKTLKIENRNLSNDLFCLPTKTCFVTHHGPVLSPQQRLFCPPPRHRQYRRTKCQMACFV